MDAYSPLGVSSGNLSRRSNERDTSETKDQVGQITVSTDDLGGVYTLQKADKDSYIISLVKNGGVESYTWRVVADLVDEKLESTKELSPKDVELILLEDRYIKICQTLTSFKNMESASSWMALQAFRHHPQMDYGFYMIDGTLHSTWSDGKHFHARDLSSLSFDEMGELMDYLSNGKSSDTSPRFADFCPPEIRPEVTFIEDIVIQKVKPFSPDMYVRLPSRTNLARFRTMLGDNEVALILDHFGRGIVLAKDPENDIQGDRVKYVGKENLKGKRVISMEEYGEMVFPEMKDALRRDESDSNGRLAVPEFWDFSLTEAKTEAFLTGCRYEVHHRPIVVATHEKGWLISVWDQDSESVKHYLNAEIKQIDSRNGIVKILTATGHEETVQYSYQSSHPLRLTADIQKKYGCFPSKFVGDWEGLYPLARPRQMPDFDGNVKVRGTKIPATVAQFSIQRLLRANQVFSKSEQTVYTLKRYPISKVDLQTGKVEVLKADGSTKELDISDLVISEKMGLESGLVFVNQDGENYGQLGRVVSKNGGYFKVLIRGEIHVYSGKDLRLSGLNKQMKRKQVSAVPSREHTQYILQSLEDQTRRDLGRIEEIYQDRKFLERPELSKYFPESVAWMVGHHDLTSELGAIAARYGIQLIGSNHKSYTCLVGTWLDVWTQDHVSSTETGLAVPCLLATPELFGQNTVARYVKDSWKKTGLPEIFDCIGSVYERHDREMIVALMVSMNMPVRPMLTYSEGGNMLSGRLENGEPFVIIGRDTVRFNERMFEELKIDPRHVKKAFAIDYGVKEEHVFYVEQAGDFHVDMSISLVGPKTVMMNDAQACIRVQEDLGYEGDISEKHRELAAKRKQWEDSAEKDLIDQGFTVHRVAGDFFNHEEDSRIMNFFNMVQLQTPKGKVIISLGCTDDRYKRLFEENLTKFGLGDDVEICYLDAVASKNSLANNGGIACQVKAIRLDDLDLLNEGDSDT